MSKKSRDLSLNDAQIQLTFGIVPLLRAVHQTGRWQAFVSERSSADEVRLLAGLRLLLRVILNEYLAHFRVGNFLRFSADRKTERALFVGLPLDKVPNTSEFANVIKNLGKLFDGLYHARSLQAFKRQANMLDRKFVRPLSVVFETNVVADPKLAASLRKEDLLRIVARGRLWSAAHDLDRWVPLELDDLPFGLPWSDRERKSRKQLDFHFPGYKATLAYLWNELFDAGAAELVGEILNSQSWEELEATRKTAHELAIEGAEVEHGIRMGWTRLFRKQGKVDKGIFEALLKTSQKPTSDLNGRIDEALLWYQFELIDSARSKIFSGAATFISLLQGEVLERSLREVRQKVPVIRFRHPGEPVMFSYGILMERFGSLSDFSGWLLFLEIGGDYAGAGGTDYLLTELKLKQLKKEITVTELEVDVQRLREFFLMKIRETLELPGGGVGDTDFLRFRVDDLELFRRISLARLLEFVTKAYYEEEKFEAKIYFDDKAVLSNRLEIDILAVNPSRKHVVVAECQLQVHVEKIPDFVKEINAKLDQVRANEEYASFERFDKVFITSADSLAGLRSLSRVREQFTDSDIRIITIEEDIIPKLPKRFNRQGLLQLFRSSRNQYSDLDVE